VRLQVSFHYRLTLSLATDGQISLRFINISYMFTTIHTPLKFSLKSA
jgi:hypothetical protein